VGGNLGIGKTRGDAPADRDLEGRRTENGGNDEAAQFGFASVCVNPVFVKRCAARLTGSSSVVCTVVGFPLGAIPKEMKALEARRAVREGASEIDMVIAIGALKSGDHRTVEEDIRAVAEAAHDGGAILKVILETGELGTLDRVRRASVLAMHAGADFIKTSTGKIQPAATLPVTLVMLQAIRDHYQATGRRVGMKAAGGIAKAKQALQYLVMLRETLGEGWLTAEWFRFGASSLVNDVLMQLEKQRTGVYQSADYFSRD